MSMLTITQYTHRPNMTELGWASTHETYMLVNKEFDLFDIFPPQIEIEVTDTKSAKKYELKSAYGREFRVNQMGEIYRDYKVCPGDEVVITKIEKDNSYDVFLTVNTNNSVVFHVTNNGAEIANIERLKGFSKDNPFSIRVFSEEKEAELIISFKGSNKKRTDSPISTDFYNVELNGNLLKNGRYFLSMGEKPILKTEPKGEYGKVKLNENLIKSKAEKLNLKMKENKLQQIYYGAPGTGKSYDIDCVTKTQSTIRTTFHPDSDYSTFVGAYKPTMETKELRDLSGHVVEGVNEKRITYTFVKQAFLKAYLSAWKKYADNSEKAEAQFLVIEEINRGNCAQIFGDLFQLLDRNDNGFSSYPIEADADLQKEIERAFKEDEEYKIDTDLQVAGAVNGYTSNYGKSLSEDILEGRVLLLPNNLYIWATMNTSDQSLFPIDSAFKRRWDWKYVRITNGYERDENGKRKLDENGKPIPLGWQIEANGEKFDWWNFVQTINEKIAAATESDDKKLGYFFCKAKDGIIDAETFVGKVIFYLWNDVFKDEDAEIFKLANGVQATFDQFYKEDEATGEVMVDEETVSVFLKKLGLGTTETQVVETATKTEESI